MEAFFSVTASSPMPTARSPGLLLIHRRVEMTLRVFAAIREARPARLLLAADGPEDDPHCQECRALVLDGVDWPCEVETRLLKLNEGCKKAVAGALGWAFSRHECLIVLEDDCLPHPSFFPFCDEMLGHYADVPRVMQICGSNLTGHQPRDGASSFLSRFGPIWGWASWRRAWAHYDVAMRDWPSARAAPALRAQCSSTIEWLWRRAIFNAVHGGEIDTWDYQWAYAKVKSGGLSLIPRHNLVSNLGFGPGATHTHDAGDPRACLPAREVGFPLVPPREVAPDEQADALYRQKVVGLPPRALSIRGLRWLGRYFLRQARAKVR